MARPKKAVTETVPEVTAAKAAAEKKPAAKKAPAKKTVVKESIVLQFAGKEVGTAEIMQQVKAYWTKELKNKAADIKEVTLYLKPEESKAYFVINGDATGSVEL